MVAKVVIGAQWGDEGKGKVVDLLAQDSDIIARFNGGDNTGHTVVNAFGTFVLRLIPTGIFNLKAVCIIGSGVVINLSTLGEELTNLKNAGIDPSERLWISPRCHVVMPYHRILETIYEESKGQERTDTTKRGIGPVYSDKVSYNGIRLSDLNDEALFAEKVKNQLKVKNPFLEAFGYKPLELDSILRDILSQYAQIRKLVREPFGFLQDALAKDADLLVEGAQSALLDTDWGTYPFCTASTTLPGGISAGLGIAPRWVTHVIGVAKAYTARVGNGPMPTELFDDIGELLQKEGHEYGTITGRIRRCGWFDAELVNFTAQLSGMTELILTKLDVLDTLSTLKIGVGYHYLAPSGQDVKSNGRPLHYWEGDTHWLERCEPVYENFDGWMLSTRFARSFAQLPIQAQKYIRRLEELVGVPIRLVSVGPKREQIIEVPPF